MRRRQLYGIMIVSIAIIFVMFLLNIKTRVASQERFEGKVQLENFWGNADKHSSWPGYHEYFEKLFRRVSQNYDKIIVYSVFGDLNNLPTRAQRLADTRVLHVQFSGEAYFNEPSLFDINLLPHKAETGKDYVVIPHTLGGQRLYVYNLVLDYFYRPRNYDVDKYAQPGVHSKFCSFIVSNGSATERVRFFEKLNQQVPVDSCGGHLRNVNFEIPEFETAAYFAFMSQYKFNICFENTRQDYYFTEKLINAYYAKCVPIYYGCPKLPDYINLDAIVYIDDASDESLSKGVERVLELHNDPAKYRSVYEQPLFKHGKVPPELDLEALENVVFSAHKQKSL